MMVFDVGNGSAISEAEVASKQIKVLDGMCPLVDAYFFCFTGLLQRHSSNRISALVA